MLDRDVNIKIGKTVIETLTQGMYEDPRFVYREYIQNAADAIDKAVNLSILENRGDGEIFITIEKENQRIIIEDNGTGIESAKVLDMLGNIALSEKDRTKDKGFRGIGRLGGLGYCDTLIFETSYSGEPEKTTMKWDAFSLRQKLYDKNITDDASEIVKSVVTISKEAENPEKHYFKIILESVDNDKLLNLESITNYLSMIAPVPFDTPFYYKTDIYKYASDLQYCIDEYKVFINEERLYKPYKINLLNSSGQRYDEIFNVKFFYYKTDNGDILAWGWYGLSEFEKQIPEVHNYFRGIRLRKGNIEIGNDDTFKNNKITREPRANGYFIGEVYCVHSNLIPNSRRDYFNDNTELKQLEKSLRELFHNTLHNLYYMASNYRGAVKTVNKVSEIANEMAEIEKTGGYTSSEEKQELLIKLDTAKKQAVEAEKKIQKIEDMAKNAGDVAINSVISRIKETYQFDNSTQTSVPESPDTEKKPAIKKRPGFTKQENKLINKILEVIKKTLTPDMSKPLIEKIEEELEK